jgi:hypothetical protein
VYGWAGFAEKILAYCVAFPTPLEGKPHWMDNFSDGDKRVIILEQKF